MSDAPRDEKALMEEAHELIRNHATGLCRSASPGAPIKYSGSGTFVRVGDKRCLLTNAHVWENFQRRAKTDFEELIGFTVAGRASVTVSSFVLIPLHVSPRPEGDWDEWGPDLALLETPPSDAGRIEDAGGTFYDLTRRRESMLGSSVQLASGEWIVVGSPGEWVKDLGNQHDGAKRLSMDQVVMATTIKARHERNGHDYLDARLTHHAPPDPAHLKEYKGLSGAALWQLGETHGDLIAWDRRTVTLEGVLFNHVDRENVIRCHGRKSVYDDLLSRVL